jgi:hypothetical protein
MTEDGLILTNAPARVINACELRGRNSDVLAQEG